MENNTAAELVEVVDDHGNTIDVVERNWARQHRMRTRIVLTAVVRHNGDVLCHRRADNRPTMAGLWDLAAGGAVTPGETPQDSAQREVLEELGVVVTCTPVWEGPWNDPTAPRWVHAHVAHSEQLGQHDPTEVAEVAWLNHATIEQLGNSGQVCPDSWELLWPHVDTAGGAAP